VIRSYKIPAFLLILPVYLTLLHTHIPESIKKESETSFQAFAIHSLHNPNHHSEDKHQKDEKEHSQNNCVVCHIASSGSLATEVSIEIGQERESETLLFSTEIFTVHNTLSTSCYQRRGPPAPAVL